MAASLSVGGPVDLPVWSTRLDLADETSTAGAVVAAGVDLVDRAKLLAARSRWPGRLEERVFSARERLALRLDDGETLCVAFGIKESVIKLVGGLPRGSTFHHIELSRPDGRWRVALHGPLAYAHPGVGPVIADRLIRPGLPLLAWAAACSAGPRR